MTNKAQCSFDNILPVSVGMSKFDARNIVNSTKNITPPMYTAESTPVYVRYPYLKGDSVKM